MIWSRVVVIVSLLGNQFKSPFLFIPCCLVSNHISVFLYWNKTQVYVNWCSLWNKWEMLSLRILFLQIIKMLFRENTHFSIQQLKKAKQYCLVFHYWLLWIRIVGFFVSLLIVCSGQFEWNRTFGIINIFWSCRNFVLLEQDLKTEGFSQINNKSEIKIILLE